MHVYEYIFIYVCVHAYVYGHACISYLCPMEVSRRKYIPGVLSTPSAISWSATSFRTKIKNQESSEKWLIPGLGQGIKYKMSLEHIVMPESKKQLNLVQLSFH